MESDDQRYVYWVERAAAAAFCKPRRSMCADLLAERLFDSVDTVC
jgi:hypothetical protein